MGRARYSAVVPWLVAQGWSGAQGRAVVFSTLVLGVMLLILANRDLSRPALMGVTDPNPWLWRMAAAIAQGDLTHQVQIDGTDVSVQRMAILCNAPEADGVTISAPAASKVLIIAGKPLNEPIAQYGPFVMNTNDEIFQAVQDFQAGRFTA